MAKIIYMLKTVVVLNGKTGNKTSLLMRLAKYKIKREKMEQ